MKHSLRQRSGWIAAVLLVPVGLASTGCAFLTGKGPKDVAVAGAAGAMPPQTAAGYAGSAACSACHRLQTVRFAATDKGKLLLEHPRNSLERQGCESCHGPSAQHVATEGKQRGDLIAFGGKSPSPVDTRNAQCLQCHEKTARMLWRGSSHESRDVACTDCHSLMNPVSERANLKKETVLATCARCHQQRQAQQLRSGHMPVGERKMECTSCHNPHGSANPKLLLATSTNETCYSCHAEKRGPFMWEHPPVVENCANCHDPHGSNQPKMLRISRPRLCQQCHGGATRHPTGPKNPALVTDVQYLLNRQCANCHVDIHGSNHVSGKAFTR